MARLAGRPRPVASAPPPNHPAKTPAARTRARSRLRRRPAYEVDGISPKVAIAIGDTPKTATFFAAYSGSELPPEVQKLIDGS
ncbi:DUF6281 family protein [Streptomyces sp. NBC_00154]|uniref:DUF6281 family protein n=1 Tax=Streptomyces sp. NBC_00154 TaxID=2975670 RepID=UPI00338FFE26